MSGRLLIAVSLITTACTGSVMADDGPLTLEQTGYDMVVVEQVNRERASGGEAPDSF